MDRRHAPPVDESQTEFDTDEMEADGLPGRLPLRRSGPEHAPLFDRRTARIVGALAGVAFLLVIVIGVLVAERAVQQLIYPPTVTPIPTPDIAPLGPGYLQGPPSVDVPLIRRVLLSYNSPAADEAQAFYDYGVARGIDPAWCLAFFIMESAAGTQGVARTTYSIGNIRALPGQPEFEGYRQYANWREGIADWYRLIDEVYIRDRGETTIDAIVPVYAPAFDQNDPAAYIRTVKRLVARWRGY
ncbi:MAG: glucosaminidase domain-containing protein [Thermomicrobiales bacterium]